jgi:hypothetical protein
LCAHPSWLRDDYDPAGPRPVRASGARHHAAAARPRSSFDGSLTGRAGNCALPCVRRLLALARRATAAISAPAEHRTARTSFGSNCNAVCAAAVISMRSGISTTLPAAREPARSAGAARHYRRCIPLAPAAERGASIVEGSLLGWRLNVGNLARFPPATPTTLDHKRIRFAGTLTSDSSTRSHLVNRNPPPRNGS